MKDKTLPGLLVPALKARMGDWAYYISFLRFSDVAERISVVEEIHTAKSLRELLQRGLRNRAPEIAEYLRMSPQRFFNALVVGTYGGSPEWRELEVSQSEVSQTSLPEYVEGALGFLVLSGKELLFAIDGQHRVMGIREAIKEQPDLADEEITAIFLRGVTQGNRKADPAGFERTRRLFTTLNSRAKPVGKRDIIALDEDDVIAITTRTLVEENPLFRDKVNAKESRSLSPTNKTDLTTIIILYDSLDIYFKEKVKGLPSGKRRRPDDNVVRDFVTSAREFYDLLKKHFPPLAEMSESKSGDNVAENYRSRLGGHLLFRPVGFLLAHRVVAKLIKSSVTLKEAMRRLAQVPMELSAQPWTGLLWDATNSRMITDKENQRAAERLTFHALGGDLAAYRTDVDKLRQELAGLLNRKLSEVKLPDYTSKTKPKRAPVSKPR